jgi:hypothetical protein
LIHDNHAEIVVILYPVSFEQTNSNKGLYQVRIEELTNPDYVSLLQGESI